MQVPPLPTPGPSLGWGWGLQGLGEPVRVGRGPGLRWDGVRRWPHLVIPAAHRHQFPRLLNGYAGGAAGWIWIRIRGIEIGAACVLGVSCNLELGVARSVPQFPRIVGDGA